MAEKLAPEKHHNFVHSGHKVFEWDQTLEEVNIYLELPPPMFPPSSSITRSNPTTSMPSAGSLLTPPSTASSPPSYMTPTLSPTHSMAPSTSSPSTLLIAPSILADRSLHLDLVSKVDLQGDGQECVTVREDGRVNLVMVGKGKLVRKNVHDSRGLVSHTTMRWGSPTKFATGGLGFGL